MRICYDPCPRYPRNATRSRPVLQSLGQQAEINGDPAAEFLKKLDAMPGTDKK
jgi:hypothetical protein